MDLKFSPEDAAFQQEVREFLADAWPESVRSLRNPLHEEETEAERRYFEKLVEKGWSVPSWPVEHGGTGWTPTQKYIWDRESATAGTPTMSPFGTSMLAPVIYTWGSPEQQQTYLPPIRENRVQWCQGYSEPGAGSDLAALKTSAVRDGDHYVVNGSKIWTSNAHNADWIFCLVRTDSSGPKKQNGISFLLIDMKSPGIEVHPILILGNLHSVNTVTLTDVRVPVGNLVGEENKGWTYAKGLLTHERTGIAQVANSKANMARLKRIARDTDAGGAPLWDDPAFRHRVLSVEVELAALEMTELRTLATVERGGAPGPESSILKIKGTEIAQAIQELLVEVHGYYSLPYPDAQLLNNEGPIGPDTVFPSQRAFFYGRASSIFGGSNEIQRNIISKAVLGL